MGTLLAFYLFIRNSVVVKEILNETLSGGVTENNVFFHAAIEDAPFGGVVKFLIRSILWAARSELLLK